MYNMLYVVRCASFISRTLYLQQKTIIEQCGQLVEAEQWMSLVDYTLLAWSYVRATPLWDSVQHNNCRRACFKTLSSHCLQGLKNVPWTHEQLEKLLKK